MSLKRMGKLGKRGGFPIEHFQISNSPVFGEKSLSVYPKNDGPASFVQSRLAPSYGEMDQGWSEV